MSSLDRSIIRIVVLVSISLLILSGCLITGANIHAEENPVWGKSSENTPSTLLSEALYSRITKSTVTSGNFAREDNRENGSLVAVTIVKASAPGNLKITEDTSCMNTDCHSAMGTEKFVHGPVAEEQCVFCHSIVDNKHRFTLMAEGKELCYGCHESKENEKHIHGAVEAGMCTSCHDPHQSPHEFQLRGSPISELCHSCHDSKIETEFVHGPVAMGECGSCHDPHESPNQYQLLVEGNDLCFQCHGLKQEELETREFKHFPAVDSCITCHNPHGSENPFWLEAALPDLCTQCHDDIYELLENSKVVHGALHIKKKCANCHDPHSSDLPKQLVAPTMNICLGCHNEPISVGGRTLSNIKALLDNNKEWHGPLKDEDCTACHNPHASNNFRMLQEYFPPTLYAPFKVSNYALCFGCHDSSLVMDKSTTSDTEFRNGKRNLHFLHVNKAAKGRVCKACHQPHASKKPKYIREGVPFGHWEIPINYAKSETGGKCSPGCHSPKQYDREHRVRNKK